MNPKIKALEQQCWSHRVDGVLVDGHLHFDTAKFAELIVRECMSYMKDGDIDFAKFMIKRNFGVEE